MSTGQLLSITMPALCADRRTLNNLFVEILNHGQEEPFQYVQFSEWQNSLAEEEDAEKGREFWSRQDLSTTSVALPGQVSRKATSGEQRSTPISLPGNFATRITKLADQFETTSATVLLAAWQTLLWRLTRQSIVIGNVSDGRSYDLLEDVCGLF